MKIAMIVLNAVSHDVRVLKEAQALVEEGHQLSIVGIMDNKSLPYEVLNGIEIFRIHRGRRILSKRQRMRRALINPQSVAISVLLLLAAYLLLLVDMQSPEDVWNNTKAIVIPMYEADALPVLLIILAGVSLFGRAVKTMILTCWRHMRNLKIIVKQLVSMSQFQGPALEKLASIQPDILHCHDLSGLIVGSAYRKRHDCKVVYDSHEIYEETHNSSQARKIMVTRTQKKLSRIVDALITVNDSAANYINTKYKLMPQAVVVKNASPFTTPSEPKNHIREALGLPNEINILLFQGGFSHGRGLIALVDSARYLDSRWVIVFMGWGKMEETLTARAAEQGTLNTKIFFLDKVSHDVLAEWTSSATVGIIPYENTCLNHLYCSPNKLWEYPIAGLPIMVTDLVELRRAVEEYEIGWIINEPPHPLNIANVTNRISSEQLEHARQKCHEYNAIDNWQKYKTRLLDLYRTLIAGMKAENPVSQGNAAQKIAA